MDPLNRQITNRKLLALLEVIKLFMKFDKEIPAQVISTYLYDDCIQLPGCNEYSLSGYLMYLYYFLDFYWKNYRKDKFKV